MTDTMFSRQLTFAARVDVRKQGLFTFKIFSHFFMPCLSFVSGLQKARENIIISAATDISL